MKVAQHCHWPPGGMVAPCGSALPELMVGQNSRPIYQPGELRVRFLIPRVERGSLNALEMATILGIATGIVEVNKAYFFENPDAPCCLGCADVTYVPPENCAGVPLCQYADTASWILSSGRVTCLGAAPYVVAKNQMNGESASLWLAPMEQRQQTGTALVPHQYHLVVRLGDGSLYDPIVELTEAPGACVGECEAHD